MHRAGIVAISCALMMGCARQSDETQEIVDNLIQARFRADDIAILRDTVYVGRDAEVSLAASREMLETTGSTKEQYRTSNMISRGLSKICVDGSTFTGVFSTALDLAIQNYDEQPLTFAMARAPSTGCSFTIAARFEAGLISHSGFPSGGMPFGSITIADGLSTFSVNTIADIITHEIGHTIGFRHSDYFDRSISCGGPAENEGTTNGAIYIPSTPAGTTPGGSVMNSCPEPSGTGRFRSSDITALLIMYGIPAPAPMHYKIERLVTCGRATNGWFCAPLVGVPCTTSFGLCVASSPDCVDAAPPNNQGIFNLICSP